ncbi:MAG: DNA polymerase III subunit delta' [Firmicutes bacterium]|nr:DNA polymerase III subunit delta' [Bacillota bacterium]
MGLNSIVGQSHVVTSLQRSLRRGRVVHGYLFVGADGLGKRTTAEALAMALFCPIQPMAGCGKCPTCLKVREDKHPDWHRLRAAGTQIGIDEIRQLRQALSLEPYEADYKVALIEEAERMTVAAANSILKFLEEPIGEAIIILTVNNMAQVLPTIVSRCQVHRFSPVPGPELAQALIDRGIPETEAWKRAFRARGITGYALTEASDEADWDLAKCGALCDQLINTGADWLFKQTNDWGYDALEAERLVTGLQEWFRLILIYKATGELEISQPEVAEQLERQANRFTLKEIAAIQEQLATARHALSLHVNTRLTIDALLVQIHFLATVR